MKILAVSARYPTAMQTWFINYLEAIDEVGAQAEVLSLEKGEENYHPKVDQIKCQTVRTYRGNIITDLLRSFFFIFFSGRTSSVFSVLRDLRKDGLHWKELLHGVRGLHLYPKIDANIIHCHSEKAAVRVLPLLLLLRKPVVLTFHGLPPQGVQDIQSRQRNVLVKHIKVLLVNTQFAYEQYKNLVMHQLPVEYIKQSINLSDFPFVPKNFPRSSDTVKVLTVGRIDRLKGHKLAIEAIVGLSREGYKLRYTIVGAGYYTSELEDYIFDKGANDMVSIEPPAMGEALLRYFESHDIFILPSFTERCQWAETQGIVVQEAQACGLPVIASDSGGIPECVRRDEDALVFKQREADCLSAELKRILNSEVLWNRLVYAGRRNVETFYSLREMGQQLLNVYHSI